MEVPLARVLGRRRTPVALVMAVGAALLSISPTSGSAAADPPPAQDTVAVVNGEPLPRAIFDRTFLGIAEHYVRFGPGLPLERMWSYRLEGFDKAVDEQLLRNEALVRGLSVSADEIEAVLDKMVNQYLAQLGTQGDDLEQRLAQACAALGGPTRPAMTEVQFRLWLRDWLRPRYGEEAKVALMGERLKAQMVPAPLISEEDIRSQFATITLRTIAIRHRWGDRWEEAEREARERAEGLLRRIREGADFAALAATASDDERYKESGGLEGTMLLATLNPDRRKAVASLRVGEVTELIRTDRGYEIMRVEARGYQLPPDYEESKPELRARLVSQQQEQAWQNHVTTLHEAATITVTDPELQACTALREGKEEEALALLETASQDAESLGAAGAASVFFQLAARYSLQNRWDEATRAYASSDHYVSQVLTLFPDARVATLFGLGHTYENLGLQLREQQQAEQAQVASSTAVEYYQDAGRHTGNPSHHDRLRLAYARLGRADLAEQEAVWLARQRSAMKARRKAIEKAREPMADGAGAGQ